MTNQFLFGAAYYHEYQTEPRLERDLDLMVEAGFTVIRVGESVWSTWEPENGRGWPGSTRRSPGSGPPGGGSRGARGRRSTTPTPRSASTPSGSSAR
jgi:hypothetical protein